MWLWGEQWEEKEKKKKKKVAAIPRWTSFIYRCPPLVHWISTRIEWAIERDAGWQPQSGNRANFRPVRSDSVLLRSTLNFASFLPFFFFFANRKNAKKGKKEKRVEAYFRATRSWNRGIASLLVTSYIFSLENREGMVRVATLETPLLPSFLFPSPFHSRAEYTSERKFPAPVTFPEQVVWKVDFWKGREWVKREKFLTVIDSTRRENRAIALHSLLDTLSDPFGGSSLATRPSHSTSTCFDSIHPFLLSSVRP